MTDLAVEPSAEEIRRVHAWEAKQANQRKTRRQVMYARRACPIHGHSGRIIYGPAVWGYGPTCGQCRREWSRRYGRPWESDAQARERQQQEHQALIREIAEMEPLRFYLEFEALRQKRSEQTRRVWWEVKPDEFGVSSFGSATPEGERYHIMRARVQAERRMFEEARDAI